MSEYIVISSPKKVYWVEMPNSFDDNARIELLKHDILAFDCRESEFHSLKDSNQQIYLFNLDKIFELYEAQSKEEQYASAADLVQKINDFHPEKSIVHSNIIDPKLESIFKRTNIHFLRLNLYDTQKSVPTIVNLLRNFMSYESYGSRAFVRIVTHPQMSLRVNLALLSNVDLTFAGVLKDISLNGAAIEVKNAEHLSHFKLKELVKAKIYLPRHATKVQAAVITRVDLETQTVGIHFDPLNSKMIYADEADALSNFIFYSIKAVLPEIEKVLV